MVSAIRVQILDKSLGVTLYVNALGNAVNLFGAHSCKSTYLIIR